MTEPTCKIAGSRCAPERVEETLRAKREVIQAIRATEPGTRLYSSCNNAADPTRFLNVMIFNSTAAEEAHRGSAAVKRFADVIYPAPIDEVEFTDYRLVDST